MNGDFTLTMILISSTCMIQYLVRSISCSAKSYSNDLWSSLYSNTCDCHLSLVINNNVKFELWSNIVISIIYLISIEDRHLFVIIWCSARITKINFSEQDRFSCQTFRSVILLFCPRCWKAIFFRNYHLGFPSSLNSHYTTLFTCSLSKCSHVHCNYESMKTIIKLMCQTDKKNSHFVTLRTSFCHSLTC